MKKISTPDEYFDSELKYSEELKCIRSIILKTGLTETIKWGVPTYTFGKELVVACCEFNNHFGVWFYQGALLADPNNRLMNASPGKTKALRQWRMKAMNDIDEPQMLQFIYESVENFRLGRKILPERDKKLDIPDELSSYLENNPEHSRQFEKLNLTCKKEFCEYIESAKRIETKLSRIEKISPLILAGIGLNDKYR